MRVAEDAPFPRRGGPPAVDLVNTEVVVRGRPVDLLPDDAAAAAWTRFEAGRLGVPGPAPARRDELAALRTLLRRLLADVAEGSAPAAGDLAALNALAAREPVTLTLEWSGAPRLRATATEGDTVAAVARSCVEFLAAGGGRRLRPCANPRCVLLFVASNARQRWCSEACGRRVRAARFARRHADAGR